ncbi:MAG: M12 family metallo-peptidase, partial [Planctomycetota bacterium]
MTVKTFRSQLRPLCVAAVAALINVSALPASAEDVRGDASGNQLVIAQELESQDARGARLTDEISAIAGVDVESVVTLDLVDDPTAPILAELPLDDGRHLVLLVPHSIRAAGYQLLAQGEASLLPTGLTARIQLDGEEYWVQPVEPTLPNALPGDHMIYKASNVAPVEASCGLGLVANDIRRVIPPVPESDGGIAGTPCIAELACDADTEYFNDYGSITAVQNRINLVMNLVNLQYEAQVGITHQITTILVRTSTDPYTSLDPQQRLCQFITEWSNNQSGIQRDVAQLFTGAQIDGSVIGIAADIGNTGICVNNGGCTGGTFGTFGSYCMSQSDFNGVTSCATDLSAHELGHLWGAFHCNCSGNTMNPSVTCSNSFSAGSISSITAYRNTRACLTGDCPGGPVVPDNDDCEDAVPFNDGNGDGTVDYSTFGATTDGPVNPSNQCNDFGQNQTHQDIWYTYTATCTGTLTVTTCDDIHGEGDPTYDTDLVVYGPYTSAGQINCNNLDFLACNDDDPTLACGTNAPFSSTIQVSVTQGEVILVRVGGWSAGDQGSGVLSIECNGVVTGACCFADGSCTDTTSNSCATQDGIFQGNGTNCSSITCPVSEGACCFSNGACAVFSSTECPSFGGIYQGDGTACADVDCPQPEGACCFSNGACAVFSGTDCSTFGGVYQGDDTACADVNCPQPEGAGCLADGTCANGTAADCAGQGGTYQGDSSDCAGANCPQPTGACCLLDGTCTNGTADDCAGAGGVYQGDFSDCGKAQCPQPEGACCFIDGTCAGLTDADCAGQGGTYQGNFSECGSANCPQPTGA